MKDLQAFVREYHHAFDKSNGEYYIALYVCDLFNVIIYGNG